MIDYSQDIKILAIENAILRKKYDELRKLVHRTWSEIISLELEYEDYGMPWLGNLEIESYKPGYDNEFDYYNIDINDFKVSKRCMNAFIKLGCKTIGDVISHSMKDFITIPNCGKKTIREIEQLLKELNMKMGTDIDALKLEYVIPWEPPIGLSSPQELKEMVINYINTHKSSMHIRTQVRKGVCSAQLDDKTL